MSKRLSKQKKRRHEKRVARNAVKKLTGGTDEKPTATKTQATK